MLCKSLAKRKANTFPWQRVVYHVAAAPRITRCCDFLPPCFSTHSTVSPPASVIRAECINLVFIYSPWMQRGPIKLETLLCLGSALCHCWNFLWNPETFLWPPVLEVHLWRWRLPSLPDWSSFLIPWCEPQAASPELQYLDLCCYCLKYWEYNVSVGI